MCAVTNTVTRANPAKPLYEVECRGCGVVFRTVMIGRRARHRCATGEKVETFVRKDTPPVAVPAPAALPPQQPVVPEQVKPARAQRTRRAKPAPKRTEPARKRQRAAPVVVEPEYDDDDYDDDDYDDYDEEAERAKTAAWWKEQQRQYFEQFRKRTQPRPAPPAPATPAPVVPALRPRPAPVPRPTPTRVARPTGPIKTPAQCRYGPTTCGLGQTCLCVGGEIITVAGRKARSWTGAIRTVEDMRRRRTRTRATYATAEREESES